MQGSVGDCWLAATMASIVLVDADVVKSFMVQLENTGTNSDRVQISLWDYDKKTHWSTIITINEAYTSKIDFTWDSGNRGVSFVWPKMLAMAVQQLADSNPNLGIVDTLDGGLLDTAFKVLDGKGYVTTLRIVDNMTPPNLWALLESVKTKSTVVLTYSGTNGGVNVEPVEIPGGHAYTVMDSDPSGQTVTLRNPWGFVAQNPDGSLSHGGPDVVAADDGVFTMPFDDFRKVCNKISQYGTPPNYPSALSASASSSASTISSSTSSIISSMASSSSTEAPTPVLSHSPAQNVTMATFIATVPNAEVVTSMA